ncbi:MAG: hypothetical protein EBZ48_11685 [Proteobacteria bacterium]|nr:hypothetical protein [Pseudomonadota bacterium]
MKLPRPLIAVLLAVSHSSVAVAQDAACIQERLINTGAVISTALAGQINEFPESYLSAPLLGKVGDFNQDGVDDLLSAEGAGLNQVVIRSGTNGNILWGPFDTGPNSLPNQLAAIGDFNNDGRPEFAIAVRRTGGSAQPNGAWVFNGSSGALIDSFPSNIAGRQRKLPDAQLCSPLGLGATRPYSPAANTTGMSAAIAQTPVGKKIIFADSNSYGGQALYTHTCQKEVPCDVYGGGICCQQYACYIEATITNDRPGMINRDFGGQMVNLRNLYDPTAAPQLFIADPSGTYSVAVPPPAAPVDLTFSGMVYKYHTSANTNLVDSSSNLNLGGGLLPRAAYVRMGYLMTDVGDIDGDGCLDLAVSSPGDTQDSLIGGVVDFYRGCQSTHPVYKTLLAGIGAEGAQFGLSVSGSFDMNGNGIKDVIVGAPGKEGSGRVQVYSVVPNDAKAKFTISNPVGGYRFGHSVVALSNERFAVADGGGNLQFIKLGADVTGPQGKADGIPDRCQMGPTPTPGTGNAGQEKLDRVYTTMVNMTSKVDLLVRFEPAKGYNQADRLEVTQLLKGLDTDAKSNHTVVKDNQQLFSAVSNKLTGAAFNGIITRIKALSSTYHKKRPRKEKRKQRLNTRSSLAALIKALEPGVTPSIRRS